MTKPHELGKVGRVRQLKTTSQITRTRRLK